MGRPGNIEPDDLKNIPTFRAAYSDRTALLMARLAQRAYEPFHEGGAAFDTFPDELRADRPDRFPERSSTRMSAPPALSPPGRS